MTQPRPAGCLQLGPSLPMLPGSSSPPCTDETNPDSYTRLLSNSEQLPMEKLRRAVEEAFEQMKPLLDVALAQGPKNLTDVSGQAGGITQPGSAL